MKLIQLILILVSTVSAWAQNGAAAKPCPRCLEMTEIINAKDLLREQKLSVDFDLAADPEVAKQEAFAYTILALTFIPIDKAFEDSSSAYYDIYNRHKGVMEAALRRLKPEDQKILRKSLAESAQLFKTGGK